MSLIDQPPTPTPGRIVLFRDAFEDVKPAIVTDVDGQFCDLVVFDAAWGGAGTQAQKRVGMAAPDNELRGWFWPERKA